MLSDCYACRLIDGAEPLPGGSICATEHWVVEHCTGPLGVGTLIVKPFRHCLYVGDLSQAEAEELGSLLRRVSQVIQTLTRADQVYVCLSVVPCSVEASAYPFCGAASLECLARFVCTPWPWRADGHVSGESRATEQRGRGVRSPGENVSNVKFGTVSGC